MTLAIGARCEGGLVLYADRRIILSDGSITEACKIFERSISNGKVALATASNDFTAAQGFANHLLDALQGKQFADAQSLTDNVRARLLDWSSPYKQDEPQLSTQFLMAFELSGQVYLYVVEPRNTVSPVQHKAPIGSGMRVVFPLLDLLLPETLPLTPKQTIFHLAYLMRHAKEQESAVGGGSDARYFPVHGHTKAIDTMELSSAEQMTEFVDECLYLTIATLTELEGSPGVEILADRQRDLVVRTANILSKGVKFTALEESTF